MRLNQSTKLRPFGTQFSLRSILGSGMLTNYLF